MKRSLLGASICIVVFALGCSKAADNTSTATTTAGTATTTTTEGAAPAPAATGSTTTGAATTASAAGGTDFKAVQAVFTANCMPCHGGPKGRAKVNLTSYDAVIKSGDSGPVVLAGDPDNSKLVKVIKPGGKPHMPPKGNLSDADIKTISDWVKAGAKNG